MLRRSVLAVLVVLLPMAALSQSVRIKEEPTVYHGEPYDDPVPETLAGATVIADDEEAHRIWQDKNAVFIDVFPRTARPEGLPKGTVWRDKPRVSIPGSYWLPNVGYEAIPDEIDVYFRAGLQAASGGDLAQPIVIFCRADCWMSWNAAKRAMTYGYTDISWYPDGTDGWRFMEYDTEKLKPFE